MIISAFGRLVVWSFRKIGGQTLVSLILLMVILGSLAGGLSNVMQGLDSGSFPILLILGLIAGWSLARTRLRGWQAGLLVLLTGLAFNLAITAKIGTSLIHVGQAAAELIWEALQWRKGSPPLDTHLVVLFLQDAGQRVAAILQQGMQWSAGLLQGKPAFDPAVANPVWGSVLWVTAAWAGWAVRRHGHAFLAALPAAALLAASLSYGRASIYYLASLLVGAFLLQAWISYQHQEHRWKQSGVDTYEDAYFELVPWTVTISVGAVALALACSYFSPQMVFASARRLVLTRSAETNKVGQFLGLEVQPNKEGNPVGVGQGSLPRLHLLGSGPELSKRIVMIVHASFNPSINTEAGSPRPDLYWRELNYDIYTGHGWATSETRPADYPANQPIPNPPQGNVLPVSLEVKALEDLGDSIFAAGTLVQVNQNSQVLWRMGEKNSQDSFAARLLRPEKPLAYQAQSWLTIASQEQLRAAGVDYPLWVQQRYLQLPEATPERVMKLASALTENASTPYDKALAIENYLRKLPYSLEIPAPPADRDVTDFFLFDLKKGYCDYFATAMAVLSRAAGIPARLVVGYASGAYDAEHESYVVSEAEAHSWVEIYFPGIGWVEFEPTSSRQAIQRPERLPKRGASQQGQYNVVSGQDGSPVWVSFLAWAGAAITLVGVFLILRRILTAWQLGRMSPNAAITGVYLHLYQHGQRLHLPVFPGDTPYEFIERLSGRLNELCIRSTRRGRLVRALLPAGQEARQLVDLYTLAIYCPRPVDSAALQKATRTWKRLRFRLWLARILAFIQAH